MAPEEGAGSRAHGAPPVGSESTASPDRASRPTRSSGPELTIIPCRSPCRRPTWPWPPRSPAMSVALASASPAAALVSPATSLALASTSPAAAWPWLAHLRRRPWPCPPHLGSVATVLLDLSGCVLRGVSGVVRAALDLRGHVAGDVLHLGGHVGGHVLGLVPHLLRHVGRLLPAFPAASLALSRVLLSLVSLTGDPSWVGVRPVWHQPLTRSYSRVSASGRVPIDHHLCRGRLPAHQPRHLGRASAGSRRLARLRRGGAGRRPGLHLGGHPVRPPPPRGRRRPRRRTPPVPHRHRHGLPGQARRLVSTGARLLGRRPRAGPCSGRAGRCRRALRGVRAVRGTGGARHHL